jgi:PAS domain S-box-containing protein
MKLEYLLPLPMRESAERFRFLAESMPQKIFTARPNGDIDYFNRQWMDFTGLTFEQIRGWGWTQFIHPDDLEENVRRWKHSIETGEFFEFENRFRRADGEWRWHISRAHAMRDAKAQVVMRSDWNLAHEFFETPQHPETQSFLSKVLKL